MYEEGDTKVPGDLQKTRVPLLVEVAAYLEANLREVPRVYAQQTVRALFNRLPVHCAATNERAREKSTPRDFHRFESQKENKLFVVLSILTVNGSQSPLACGLLNRLTND